MTHDQITLTKLMLHQMQLVNAGFIKLANRVYSAMIEIPMDLVCVALE